MTAIYVRWILADKMTVEQVPERWRDSVCALVASARQTGGGGLG